MNHLSDDQLTLIYFRESGVSDRNHLQSCDECRHRLDQLARLLDAIRSTPVPDKPASWEPRLWGAIASRVEDSLRQPRRSPFRFWILAPALAGLLVAAFVGGMYTQNRVNRNGVGAITSFSPQARERILLIALGDYLNRSQIVLAEVVNSSSGEAADISPERQLAGSLLGENRLLRQTAARMGDTGSAAVLEQLERALLEISHAPADISSGELDDLRHRIQAQGLLFKVRVIGTNAREKGMKL